MLSLVQELEGFASSDALPDLLLLKGEAANLPSNSFGWQQIKSILDVKEVPLSFRSLSAVIFACW